MTSTPALPVRIVAGAAALAGLCAGFLSPAQAQSPVSPPESVVFVVEGVCDFDVQWDVTARDLGIETPHQFMAMSPGWTLTLTNLDTGATWSPRGNGTVSFQDLPDGGILQTLNGVDYAPNFGLQLIGHFTRVISPDGEFGEFVGHGSIVDICQRLA